MVSHDDDSGLPNSHVPCKEPYSSLEKRLFRALRATQSHSPSVKEFNEAYAFMNAVRNTNAPKPVVVLDVAGGHGALAALFLITTAAVEAVVIDPAGPSVGRTTVQQAWTPFFSTSSGQSLRYRQECLRTGLPAELTRCQENGMDPSQILVVACHACQHLSEETLCIAGQFGCQVAVMPCCQRAPEQSWKDACRNMDLSFAAAMDVLLAGRLMGLLNNSSENKYTVRIKTIRTAITPQNRIICGRRLSSSSNNTTTVINNRERAHARLQQAYVRAHKHGSKNKEITTSCWHTVERVLWLAAGVVVGAGSAVMYASRQRR